MSVEIPQDLADLPANGGLYAIWMLFQHYGVDLEIQDLVQLCRHNADEGTYGIALAVALKHLGLEVEFSTDYDPDPQPTEEFFYAKAKELGISVRDAMSYEQIQQAVDQGRFVIVYYDTLEGIGNHSLVYSIDDEEICFFDSFEPMSKEVFIQQRQQEGICQQAIIIDDRNFVMRYS